MSVPEVLRQRPQWVGYRIKQRGSPPKPTKIPIDPHTGKSAKTNDPATWAPFDDTCAAVERCKLSGLGFVFSTDDPYCGVDLDHCRDPQPMAPFA